MSIEVGCRVGLVRPLMMTKVRMSPSFASFQKSRRVKKEFKGGRDKDHVRKVYPKVYLYRHHNLLYLPLGETHIGHGYSTLFDIDNRFLSSYWRVLALTARLYI